MKNFKKLNGVVTSSVFALTCVMCLPAVAGSYHSTVQSSTIYSKNYVYTAQLPVPANVGIVNIKSVSWNWSTSGWPTGLQVYLCQGANRGRDVSRNRTGTTNMFAGSHAPQSFHYEMKVSHPGRVPVAGLLGRITVNW